MPAARAFKTKWFAKAARKRGISDTELCAATDEVIAGLSDDLGGGVFKKRLNENRDRAIILAKGGRHWIFVFLFQKADRDNITDEELAAFRLLAAKYAKLNSSAVAALLNSKDLVEICSQ